MSSFSTNVAVRTKLTPPQPHKHTLYRPRLTDRLLDALNYRLTMLQAGTGYGKSTTLAALSQTPHQLIWYQLDAEDADPLRFLLYLISAFDVQLAHLSGVPLALLEEWERNRHEPTWTAVIDRLINELTDITNQPLFLVLDDAHHCREAELVLRMLARFLSRAPANLHLILSTRYPVPLPGLVTWRVKDEILEIGQGELAFTPGEIDDLFRERYSRPLTPRQVDILYKKVEGWPITLHLVWQRLQSGSTPTQALQRLSGSAGDLFTYLAHEVLAQQEPDVQDFLRVTAVLRQMTAATCDALRTAADSREMLRYLLENGLFVVDLGEGCVRYHYLFQDLLVSQMTAREIRDAHRQAATFFQQQGDEEETIYHLLAAGELEESGEAFAQAAVLLEQLGRKMIRLGRLDTLSTWIGALPLQELENHPPLLAFLGDIARLGSRFEQALSWYQQAEQRSRTRGDARGVAQALRGQARVYLDTVNPNQAEAVLQEALRVSDGLADQRSRVRLLDLLAENMLNQGKTEQAQQYRQRAAALRQAEADESELSTRLLLRTGRLVEARQHLEAQFALEEQDPVLRPRAHRETSLLLALVLAFQGEQEAAYRYAVQGTARGEALQSGFVTAVGYMRQGHAWLLQKQQYGYEQARLCFQKAITIGDALEVPRLKVEANWGLCQAFGFIGDVASALDAAEQAITQARTAGDEWVEACVRLTMGAALTLADQTAESLHWLEQAGIAFRECSDTFGQANCRLWQCLIWQKNKDQARLERDVHDLLRLTQAHGYDCLFGRRTLFGPPDPRVLVPILLFARDNGIFTAYVQQLLIQLGLENVLRHPGYQLRVQMLGQFRVWRGTEEIQKRSWKRKKTRQLFLYLLTNRQKIFEQEQIYEALWPESDKKQAQRDFKVAYSVLLKVLEPGRNRNAPSAFIYRDGTRIGWRGTADVALDVATFEHWIAKGNGVYKEDASRAVPHYAAALNLYQEDFLPEYPYEEWCGEERERLSSLFLVTAERLGTIWLQMEKWEQAVQVAKRILAHDDCWESAYRIMIQAYIAQGERGQAMRTYQRCRERLETVLGVSPSQITVKLLDAFR